MLQSIKYFDKITNYGLVNYMEDCSSFIKNDFPQIVAFYSNKVKDINQASVEEHKRLLKESEYVNYLFSIHKSKFNSIGFFQLYDVLEDTRTKLQSINNLPKILRSSRGDNYFKNGYEHNYQISQNQTLENISENILNDKDSDNNWVDISMYNDLKEIDYDNSGGLNIRLFKEKFVQNFVASVFDVMQGKKIYGKDISRDITFYENDLKVLNYDDTVKQTVDILTSLKQGDIPEYPYLGVNSKIYVGGNISALSYGKIIRDMRKVFQTDDLFIDFKVEEVKFENDTLAVSFSVKTKLDLLIKSTSLL